MHRSAILAIVAALGLVFAGCLAPLAKDDEPVIAPGPDPTESGTPPPAAAPEQPAPPSDPAPPQSFSAAIDEFTASFESGMNFTFTMRVTTNDPDASWILEPGDGTEYSGAVAEMPESILHSYEEPGNYTAMLVVSVTTGEGAISDLLVTVKAPLQMLYRYTDPVIACPLVDESLCISELLGPEHPPIDGHWQMLDERYWGLEFQVTADGVMAATGCNAYDEDHDHIGNILNEEFTCAGTLPEGTKWLFLANFLEPAFSMELEFFESV